MHQPDQSKFLEFDLFGSISYLGINAPSVGGTILPPRDPEHAYFLSLISHFLRMSPNDVMNWVKKNLFCKMNITIELVSHKSVRIPIFNFLFHSVVKLQVVHFTCL